MNVAHISFNSVSGSPAEQSIDSVYSFLAPLLRHGNIVRGERLLVFETGLLAVVTAPEPSALDDANLSQRAKEKRKLLEPDFRIGIRQLGTVAEEGLPCTCGQQSGLLLFTTFLGIAPPLRCLNCFGYVPLYRVPVDDTDEYGDVLTWESNYKACDTLQINCGFGEEFGIHAMSSLESALTQSGLDVCADIEARTGKPTFYYLFRNKAESVAAEEGTRCPKCACEWRLRDSLHGKFDFRCDQCRLVSNTA